MVAAVVGSVNQDRENEYSLVVKIGIYHGITQELKVLNYHEAMKTVNKRELQKAISVEHEKMKNCNVFKAVYKDNVPPGTNVVDYTWAMKIKPSGIFPARLVVQGFKQEEGHNYPKDDKSSPVITNMLITIVMVMIILASWYPCITDVEGTFLHGTVQRKNEKVYANIPL